MPRKPWLEEAESGNPPTVRQPWLEDVDSTMQDAAAMALSGMRSAPYVNAASSTAVATDIAPQVDRERISAAEQALSQLPKEPDYYAGSGLEVRPTGSVPLVMPRSVARYYDPFMAGMAEDASFGVVTTPDLPGASKGARVVGQLAGAAVPVAASAIVASSLSRPLVKAGVRAVRKKLGQNLTSKIVRGAVKEGIEGAAGGAIYGAGEAAVDQATQPDIGLTDVITENYPQKTSPWKTIGIEGATWGALGVAFGSLGPAARAAWKRLRVHAQAGDLENAIKEVDAIAEKVPLTNDGARTQIKQARTELERARMQRKVTPGTGEAGAVQAAQGASEVSPVSLEPSGGKVVLDEMAPTVAVNKTLGENADALASVPGGSDIVRAEIDRIETLILRKAKRGAPRMAHVQNQATKLGLSDTEYLERLREMEQRQSRTGKFGFQETMARPKAPAEIPTSAAESSAAEVSSVAPSAPGASVPGQSAAAGVLPESWQIPRNEFIDQARQAGRRGSGVSGVSQVYGDLHESAVREAVEAGKPVPAEVLADYPLLAKSEASAGVMMPGAEWAELEGLMAGLNTPRNQKRLASIKLLTTKGDQLGAERLVRKIFPPDRVESALSAYRRASGEMPLAAPGAAAGNVPVITFDEFSASRGVPSSPPSFPEYHRAPGGISKASSKAAARRIERENLAWQNKRKELQAEYAAMLEAGSVRAPSRQEQLARIAQSEMPSEAREAARRLLTKSDGAAVLDREPWELTLAEVNETGYIGQDLKTGRAKVYPSAAGDRAANVTEHRLAVARALSEGKPVPAHVVKDYPDLVGLAPQKPLGTPHPPSGDVVPLDVPKQVGLAGGAALARSEGDPVRAFGWLSKWWRGGFEKDVVSGGRRVVNPFGTPENILRNRAIVEPFRDAEGQIRMRRRSIVEVFQDVEHATAQRRRSLAEQLDQVFSGVKRNSSEDRAIFDKLDDPNSVLTGQEAELRRYFDDLLKEINEHRGARNQPEIKRRKGYITHIVDYAREQRKTYRDLELPDELGFRFDVREGELSPRRSAMTAAEVYGEAALRDIYLGDALAKAIPAVEELTVGKSKPIVQTLLVDGPNGVKVAQNFYSLGGAMPLSERAYAEEFIKRQLGWPTRMDRAIENLLRISVGRQRQISSLVTGTFYRSLIGMAPDTMVKNLTQGIHTLSEFGLLPSMRGYSRLVTMRGVKGARAESLLDEFVPLLNDAGSNLNAGQLRRLAEKVDNVVLSGPMRFSEFVNRGAAFHSAMDFYIRNGKPIEEAHDLARAAVRKTQYGYGKLNTSPYAGAAFVRPFFQFFSFPIKTAEMLWRWGREGGEGVPKLLRYFALTGAAVTGAKYADVDLSGVFLDPLRMVDPDMEAGFKLPGSDKRVEFSADKLRKSGFIPEGPAPIVSMPLRVGEELTADDEATRDRGVQDAVRMLVPGGRFGGKLYDAFKRSQGEPVTGRRDRLVRRPSERDIYLELAGLRAANREVDETTRDKIIEIEKYFNKVQLQMKDAYATGQPEKAYRLFEEVNRKYPWLADELDAAMTDRAVLMEMSRKEMTSQERFLGSKLRQYIYFNLLSEPGKLKLPLTAPDSLTR